MKNTWPTVQWTVTGDLSLRRELEGRAALLQGSQDVGHLTSQLGSVGSRQGWWLCRGQNSRCPFVGRDWLGDIFCEATVAPVGPIQRHPERPGAPAGGWSPLDGSHWWPFGDVHFNSLGALLLGQGGQSHHWQGRRAFCKSSYAQPQGRGGGAPKQQGSGR